MVASLSLESVFSSSLQKQCVPAPASTTNHPEDMASFLLVDIQDHSTPHMKTRVAVRDRTPHRFQVIPLKDAKQTHSILQLSHKTTPVLNSTVRKGLKNVTNFQKTTPRGALAVSDGGKLTPCPNLQHELKLFAPGPVKDVQARSPSFISRTLQHRTSLKPERTSITPIPPLKISHIGSKCASITTTIQSHSVRPLNIVKRGPYSGDVSGPPLIGNRPPTVRPAVIRDVSNPTATNAAPLHTDSAAVAVSAFPAFDFLNGPAVSTSTISKHRRRSRSSNASFTSKLPTARTRMNFEHFESSELSEPGHDPKVSTTVSNPATPTIFQRHHKSSTPNTTVTPLSTPNLATKEVVRTPSATPTLRKRVSGDIQMTVESVNRTSKYLKLSSTAAASCENLSESHIPSSKLKLAFHTHTLDPVLLKPKHGITHSVDIANLNPRLLQAPRIRQYQDVRNVFPQCVELPTAVEKSQSTESVAVTPSPPLGRRSVSKSEIPSKRHAIYTRSLYVGKAEKNSSNYLQALEGMITSHASLRSQVTDHKEVSTSSDSLESILQVYQDAVNDEAHPHSRSLSMGLPTSHSEPTLYNINIAPLSVACTGITPSNETQTKFPLASGSLSSLASVYSQDSWASGERQDIQRSTATGINVIVSNEHMLEQKTGHHPIVWELLKKLEFAQRTWLWDTGSDKF
ncbi:hypothetical protein EV368DRAFT_82667 [Lentinula lateritia]|uniref:Uncharacterized protein n=1 Tax=Lentinula aff. lateritia TaxID=2804960 RepID=A0ACC1TTR4_9AGAR|nr:hypothetical protein F5876DRAFT_79090 [Lentinula aff. lateritia]KAJ3852292.1 hypothetical protein EV368DRAFT_82667 [Lentinula lateritia]